MQRRLLLIAVALVVALLGTAIVFSYSSNSAPAAVAAEPQTRVLVAKAVIPAGTTGQAAVQKGLVALENVPKRLVPRGAIVDVVAVRDKESESDIQPGEILLPSRFISTSVAGSLDIPDDKVAISVQVTDAQRVAGFVKPGLDVAVFDTYEVNEPAQPAPKDEAAAPKVSEATRLLLPRVKVIAVGPTALRTIGTTSAPGAKDGETPATGGTDMAALVTLAVSIDQAQKLAHAAQTGQLTLGLLNQKSRTGTSAADDNRTLFQ